MPQSGAEVAGVELIGNIDLGRGRRMERGHDGRRESKRGHTTRVHGGGAGTAMLPRAGSIPEQKHAAR
jgi:hypothetical protein